MDNWIRRYHPAPGARARLLCFPHAGGSAGAHHALSASVEGIVETLAVQYPGRLDRFTEPFAERLDDIVDAVLDAVRKAGPEGSAADDRPLALFGHSMGAILAFETARRLEAEGQAPVALFVSGREGPSLPLSTRVPAHPSDDDLLAEMRLLSGTADELLSSPDFLQLALPPLRADYAMLAAYVHRPGPPLRCPLVALTGDADPRVTVDGVARWARETEGPFARHVLPGGHFYLDDHLPYIADVITSSVRAEHVRAA